MIAQTYCGKVTGSRVTKDAAWTAHCSPLDGPCPSCLRAHIAKLEARNSEWETRLSAVMPADYKDWHENSRREWPEIAAMTISNLRERVEEAESQNAELQAERERDTVKRDRDELRDIRDRLEAQAAAQAGGVVVPELADAMVDAVCGPDLDPMYGPDAIVYGMRVARRDAYKKAWSDLTSRLSALPASRVLGEGCVAVSREEWEAANAYITAQRKLDGGGSAEEEVVWHKQQIAAEKRLDALRAAKGGATC